MPAKGQRKGTIQTCKQCGQEFYDYPSGDKKYCSRSCARTARNLTSENPAYFRDISGQNNPMYGKGMSGPDNPMYGKRKENAPRWTGGRKTRKDGYVFVVAPDDHPSPAYTKDSGLKYILEHRFVVEQHLGRYLEPGEVVHHKDGNPTNNDIDNLEVFVTQSEHVRIAHGSKSHLQSRHRSKQ